MGMRVLVGFDGSTGAAAAIEAGSLLLPGAHAWITYLWVPPFAGDRVRLLRRGGIPGKWSRWRANGTSPWSRRTCCV